jgi:DNA-binding CsgD family transcriptional regulator
MPVWITDPRGTISYMNSRAEALFGRSLLEWVGRPCHVCVRGRTRDGAVCCPRCRVRRDAEAGREIEPVRMRVASAPDRREVNVVVIVAEGLAGKLLVHCAIDDARERRLQRFLGGVAHRFEAPPPAAPPRPAALTRREKEILALLASDASPREIAGELSISYATVRNHIQHILPKLGVHSILEAAAVWVLVGDER